MERLAPTPASAAPPAGAHALALEARGLTKAFTIGARRLEILHGIDLQLASGELLALVGSSGAGKSTLLHCLGLLERPDSGHVELLGQQPWQLPLVERAAIRNKKIGFVFQFYHLLPELSALENVLLPAMIGESRLTFTARRREHRERATALLERFGLKERLGHRPSQLSGGERQRVAMARALYLDPPILLADEPTGNLDSATGAAVLELLLEEQRRRRLSMVLVTHDEKIAVRCQRVVTMKDGRIV
ncbi:MAG TPA: ABC transporter ATP-binding protein [Planctomycetota bacterium]